MTDNQAAPDAATSMPVTGLQIFADGCFEPRSRQGGWAFVVYRNGLEIASGCGGVRDTANNAMEVIALLEAVSWINDNAGEEAAVILSDSVHAVNGCNSWRHIWKNNGWKKNVPNGKARNRAIADRELWEAIDAELSRSKGLTISWCKGHSGVTGNERADQLAEIGRLSLVMGGPM